jgi:thiol:disulfide interchange protein DsbC
MKIMKILKACAAGILVIAATSSYGEAPKEATIKKMMANRLSEGVTVESVIKTPYGGLYEVRTSNGDIVYTDSAAKYVFIGRVVNADTMEDYTKARVDEINKINFADLPFDSAIKMVKGDGKRVIAVFEDPNCGYCKRLRQTLQNMDNVTVYSFLFNILAEDSVVKAHNIWCAPDRLKAWDDWMLNGKAAPEASASCTTDPNEKIYNLGRKMKINGTPAIFFADGSRIPGAVGDKEIEKKLASLK